MRVPPRAMQGREGSATNFRGQRRGTIMLKIVIGLFLGFAIGAACRWFDIPVPSPPRLVGALLVVAITVGYLPVDRVVATNFTHKGEPTTEHLCGGPTGVPGSLSRRS